MAKLKCSKCGKTITDVWFHDSKGNELCSKCYLGGSDD
jgi:formylmethanofuran dehydrogenase subunit E